MKDSMVVATWIGAISSIVLAICAVVGLFGGFAGAPGIIPFVAFFGGCAVGFFARGWWQSRSAEPEPEPEPQPDPNPLGLTKAALDAYGRMELDDLEAFGRLCSVSLVDYEGKELDPLVVETDAVALDMIDLAKEDLERLRDLGLVRFLEHYERVCEVVPGYHEAQQDLREGREPRRVKAAYQFKRKKVDAYCPVEFIPTQGLYSSYAFLKDCGIVAFTAQGREIARALDVPVFDEVKGYLEASLCEVNKKDWNKI